MFSMLYEICVLYNYWICFRAKDLRTNNIEDAIWQDDEDLFEGSAYEIPGENDHPRFYKFQMSKLNWNWLIWVNISIEFLVNV